MGVQLQRSGRLDVSLSTWAKLRVSMDVTSRSCSSFLWYPLRISDIFFWTGTNSYLYPSSKLDTDHEYREQQFLSSMEIGLLLALISVPQFTTGLQVRVANSEGFALCNCYRCLAFGAARVMPANRPLLSHRFAHATNR